MFNSDHNSFASQHDEIEEIFLNLTPMIDVLTCLLFFLLLSFGAVIIALISATTPAISDGGAEGTPQPKVITAGLTINKDGFEVTAKNDVMAPEELDKLKRNFSKKSGDYPYEELNGYLYQLKQKFPQSKTVIIVPDPSLDYEILIKSMDAARERNLSSTKSRIKFPLFPESVVAATVK